MVHITCQKANYHFLPENVIYFSYISGIPMVSAPEIDSRYLYFSNYVLNGNDI